MGLVGVYQNRKEQEGEGRKRQHDSYCHAEDG